MAFARSQVFLLVFFTLCAAVAEDADKTRGLRTVPKGGQQSFLDIHVKSRGAVAICFVGNSTKRHQLIESIAGDADLHELLIIGVQFTRGTSAISMYRFDFTDSAEPAANYSGLWTRTALREWFMAEAYPLVPRLRRDFLPMKYFSESPFGVVLIVRPLGEYDSALVRALEPWASKYRNRLKFTFFTRAGGLMTYCEQFGVWSNDELVLLEKPREVHERKHRNEPQAPKYRIETLTPEGIERFFGMYAAGELPRYFKPAIPKPVPMVIANGVRELTAWDFVAAVGDPTASMLVLFVSRDCDACGTFGKLYESLARLIEAAGKRDSRFRRVTLARIDQTANEHPEEVLGTPCLRYWPRGVRKQSTEIVIRDREDVEKYFDAIDEHLAQEEEEEKQETPPRQPRKTAKKAKQERARQEAAAEFVDDHSPRTKGGEDEEQGLAVSRDEQPSKVRRIRDHVFVDDAFDFGAAGLGQNEDVRCVGGAGDSCEAVSGDGNDHIDNMETARDKGEDTIVHPSAIPKIVKRGRHAGVR